MFNQVPSNSHNTLLHQIWHCFIEFLACQHKTYLRINTPTFQVCSNQTDPHLTYVTRKQTLRSLSLSYQRKDGRAWPRPSFFWYDTDFSEFDSADIIRYILEKSVSYQKKDGRGHARPSFLWYDNDKDLKVYFLVTHVILHSPNLIPNQGFIEMNTTLDSTTVVQS